MYLFGTSWYGLVKNEHNFDYIIIQTLFLKRNLVSFNFVVWLICIVLNVTFLEYSIPCCVVLTTLNFWYQQYLVSDIHAMQYVADYTAVSTAEYLSPWYKTLTIERDLELCVATGYCHDWRKTSLCRRSSYMYEAKIEAALAIIWFQLSKEKSARRPSSTAWLLLIISFV